MNSGQVFNGGDGSRITALTPPPIYKYAEGGKRFEPSDEKRFE